MAISDNSDKKWAIFEPQPQVDALAIDYFAVDKLLTHIVINTGPSLRRHLRKPNRMTGTHIRRGHTASTWEEGNKIIFEFLRDDTKKAITRLANNLVNIGNTIELTALSRNDQLAYWFNLHNLLVISEVAKHYPVRFPRKMQVLPTPSTDDQAKKYLHDAPLVTINERALSLRDIRMNIVQRYWKDPKVMYGFFHGDIASPNIRTLAWTSENIHRGLDTAISR